MATVPMLMPELLSGVVVVVKSEIKAGEKSSGKFCECGKLRSVRAVRAVTHLPRPNFSKITLISRQLSGALTHILLPALCKRRKPRNSELLKLPLSSAASSGYTV